MNSFYATFSIVIFILTLSFSPAFSADAETQDRVLILEAKVQSAETLLKKNQALLVNLSQTSAVSERRLKKARFEVKLAEHLLAEAKEELASSSKTNWHDFVSLFKLAEQTATLRVDYEEERFSSLQKLAASGIVSQNELLEAQFDLEEARNGLGLATRRLENAKLKR